MEEDMGISITQGEFGFSEDKNNHDDLVAVGKEGPEKSLMNPKCLFAFQRLSEIQEKMVWVPSTFPLQEEMLYGYFSDIFPVWNPRPQASMNLCSEKSRLGFLCHRHTQIPLHISGFSYC